MSRPRFVTAIVLGLTTAAAVVGLGVAAVVADPQEWSAEARLAVFPDETDAAARASYYETLSRGQIVSTIADLLGARLA